MPGDYPFPNLHEIIICIDPATLPFLPRLVSPHLRVFSVFVEPDDTQYFSDYDFLEDAISAIPASSLQRFALGTELQHLEFYASSEFKQEVSSTVLRCGAALKCLDTGTELSEQALLHVIQLPCLRTLKLRHESPPKIADMISLQDTIILPSLRSLSIFSLTSHAWLSFINDFLWHHPAATAIQGSGQPQAQIGIHSTLEELRFWCGEVPKWTVLKQALAFKNLTTLEIEEYCGGDECDFDLTDDNVTTLAKALPRIQELLLSHPCQWNICQTTFRSLATLSANCVELRDLDIHFNTINLVGDIKSFLESDDPAIQKLRQGQCCNVTVVKICPTPLNLDGPGLEAVARGFLFAFPLLGSQPIDPIQPNSLTTAPAWSCLNDAIRQIVRRGG